MDNELLSFKYYWYERVKISCCAYPMSALRKHGRRGTQMALMLLLKSGVKCWHVCHWVVFLGRQRLKEEKQMMSSCSYSLSFPIHKKKHKTGNDLLCFISSGHVVHILKNLTQTCVCCCSTWCLRPVWGRSLGVSPGSSTRAKGSSSISFSCMHCNLVQFYY